MNTVTVAVPAPEISAAGMAAVNRRAFTKVVVRSAPFQRTRVRSADPAKPTTFDQLLGGDGIGLAVSAKTHQEPALNNAEVRRQLQGIAAEYDRLADSIERARFRLVNWCFAKGRAGRKPATTRRRG